MKYERPRACIHGGVANTKSVIYRTRIQGFSRKTASASGKHLFFGIISARELLETFLDWFWMISMCSDSSECFYDGQSRLKPHISNEIAYVKSPMWNSLSVAEADFLGWLQIVKSSFSWVSSDFIAQISLVVTIDPCYTVLDVIRSKKCLSKTFFA